MQLRAISNVWRSGGWRRVLGAALAAMILPAVPAAATITLGTWKFSQKQQGNAPPINDNSTAGVPAGGAAGRGGGRCGSTGANSGTVLCTGSNEVARTLVLWIGRAGIFASPSSTKGARSEITATNTLTVTGPGEIVTLFHSFITKLQNGRLEVEARIEPKIRLRSRGEAKATPIKFFANNSANGTGTASASTPDSSIMSSQSASAFLRPGKFKVEIKIKYEADKDKKAGGWDNSSPHRFTFRPS